MKSLIYISSLLLVFSFGFKQDDVKKFYSKTGDIHFFSHTDIEDIEADNHKVKTAFLPSTGDIQFSVLIKDFEFEKALMQEHFNENYMESTTYPKSTFNGKILDVKSINFEKDGTYTSKVKGDLTIKDVTKEVETTATFNVKGEVVHAKASFVVNPEDYNVEIPNVVSNKISREIKITVDVDYK